MQNMTPIPSVTAYLENGESVVIDCDSRSRTEILEHLELILGKTKRQLQEEQTEIEAAKANPANFGLKFARQCICEVPGHIPCPGWQPLPKEMTGKGRKKLKQEAEENS
eukprot:GHVU01200549.1.p1 GENE.GHVU01200549.1~~GHVU01200549.1.p1  ORF type:complete len:109 (-),score=10.10 GHVU01200549.1:1142-1468(-)